MKNSRKQKLIDAKFRIVVLDDDPTGIQTVHGCLLLTDWSLNNLKIAFEDNEPFFYILTNTRAHTPERTREIIREITRNVLKVSHGSGIKPVFNCRSDSTLRGHFPLELETVIQEADLLPTMRFFIPAFFEGGRITAKNTHYLIDGDRWVPCHETEFAKDSVFGYSTAHLPSYIEEKTGASVSRKQIRCVTQAQLTSTGRQALSRLLDETPSGSYVIVNAGSYTELNRLSDELVDRLILGAEMIFQSSASFVKSLTACPDKDFIGSEVRRGNGPGLIVVGSHVKKSTQQLENLKNEAGIRPVEVDVAILLDKEESLFADILNRVRQTMALGKTPLLYTSREELGFAATEERLSAGRRISTFLSRLVSELDVTPSFLISKGGITSHDMLVQGLCLVSARVLGQAAPGVPVIRLPDTHRWAGLPVIIFPGNVGDATTLRDVFRVFRGEGSFE